VKFAPGLAVPPVASDPFQDRFVIVIALPLCTQFPDQPVVSVWLPE